MKKGLWLFILSPAFLFISICWNHWPDEKGIVTEHIALEIHSSIEELESLTWWKRDCDLTSSLTTLLPFFLCWNHWPDEKGIVTFSSPLFKFFNYNWLESLTWWKRDCDCISCFFNCNIHQVGIIDLMKKGLWLLPCRCLQVCALL